MDPESKELLQKTFALAEENNKILHKMRRSQMIASVIRVFYFIIIIGIAVGSFYFLQPYIDKGINLYNSLSATGQKLNNVSLESLLKKLGN